MAEFDEITSELEQQKLDKTIIDNEPEESEYSMYLSLFGYFMYHS